MKSKSLVKLTYRKGLYIVTSVNKRWQYPQIHTSFKQVLSVFPLELFDIKVCSDSKAEFEFLDDFNIPADENEYYHGIFISEL